MTLPCNACGNQFTKDEGRRGRVCRDCKNKKQRDYRKLCKDGCTKKYEKSISGYLMRMYRNMKSRIEGVQEKKWHLYKGKYLLPKREFYLFAIRNQAFLSLYRDYKKYGYPTKLAPSINRIDADDGYRPGNIEFITQSENSRLGAVSRWRQNEKGN